jgi:hypothetical protein
MARESIPHAMQFRDVNRIKLFRVFMVFSFGEDAHRLLPHRANRKIQAGRIIDLKFF